MKRFTFRHLQGIVQLLLLTAAVVLLVWRQDRQAALQRRMDNSFFNTQFYYTLRVDSGHVADYPRITDVYRFMEKDSNRLDTLSRGVRYQQAELDYYLQVHNVQDEGYNMIADFTTTISHKSDSLKRLLAYLAKIESGAPYAIEHNTRYYGQRKKIIRTDIKRDSAGVYTGEMDSIGRPQGHGSYAGTDGSYYEGAWQEGKRHGFGFYSAPFKPLRAGEWQEDRYLGERLHYTSERIYGIDISRYQHEKGKKRYAIQWNKMRITHLGTLSKKKVTGKVDYPVSFVYIKSTEGTTIRNKYFATDYVNARKQGIHTGAYHFFSTRTTGAAQAAFFLKNTRYQKGDFPPVLDVEPYPSQIKAMGGTNILFANIRAWLSIVHKRTGIKPVLYVSQTFVNKYLNEAPDIKKDYKIWIARYGEYKPDVRLIYWQLCPDGRVSGIHGEVDINVFNGYNDQYEEFLSSLRD